MPSRKSELSAPARRQRYARAAKKSSYETNIQAIVKAVSPKKSSINARARRQKPRRAPETNIKKMIEALKNSQSAPLSIVEIDGEITELDERRVTLESELKMLHMKADETISKLVLAEEEAAQTDNLFRQWVESPNEVDRVVFVWVIAEGYQKPGDVGKIVRGLQTYSTSRKQSMYDKIMKDEQKSKRFESFLKTFGDDFVKLPLIEKEAALDKWVNGKKRPALTRQLSARTKKLLAEHAEKRAEIMAKEQQIVPDAIPITNKSGELIGALTGEREVIAITPDPEITIAPALAIVVSPSSDLAKQIAEADNMEAAPEELAELAAEHPAVPGDKEACLNKVGYIWDDETQTCISIEVHKAKEAKKQDVVKLWEEEKDVVVVARVHHNPEELSKPQIQQIAQEHIDANKQVANVIDREVQRQQEEAREKEKEPEPVFAPPFDAPPLIPVADKKTATVIGVIDSQTNEVYAPPFDAPPMKVDLAAAVVVENKSDPVFKALKKAPALKANDAKTPDFLNYIAENPLIKKRREDCLSDSKRQAGYIWDDETKSCYSKDAWEAEQKRKAKLEESYKNAKQHIVKEKRKPIDELKQHEENKETGQKLALALRGRRGQLHNDEDDDDQRSNDDGEFDKRPKKRRVKKHKRVKN